MTSPKYRWKRPPQESKLLPFIPQHWPKGGSDRYQSTFTTAEVKGFPRAVPSMKPNQSSPITFYPAKSTGSQEKDLFGKHHTCPSAITALPCPLPLGLHRCSGPQKAPTKVPTLSPAPPLSYG